MEFRRPTLDESRLLTHLASVAGMKSPDDWVATLRVRNMEDGGMGSLELLTPEARREIGGGSTVTRRAAVQFTDVDGVEVIASLDAHEDGIPFELDVWKTDFSRLMRIPQSFRLVEE